MHLDDAGDPTYASGSAYSPFGVPQSGALPAPFGFTGELHANDLVYLRARWYDPASGMFLGRDPWQGEPTRPASLHKYAYTENDPVLKTDPTGHQCQGCEQGPPPPPWDPSPLPPEWQPPEPEPAPEPPEPLEPFRDTIPPDCVEDPPHPGDAIEDIGYIEGVTGNVRLLVGATGGSEGVYDLYDFEYGLFDFAGWGLFASIGFEASSYAGEVYGWSNFEEDRGVHRYSGTSYAVSAEGSLAGVSGGLIYFWSPGHTMWGYAGTIGGGPGLSFPVDGSIVTVEYTLVNRIAFHGVCENPTSEDAKQFSDFIEMNMLNPTRKQEAQRIVRRNGEAWDRFNARQGNSGSCAV